MSDPIPKGEISRIHSIAMTQQRGHRRWAFLLFLAFFCAPFVTLFFHRAFTWSELVGLRLLFLIVIVLLTLLALLFFARKRWYKQPPFEGLKDGAYLPLTIDDMKNRTRWRQRVIAVTNGMLNFEFFGWIVWVTAVLAGIASSFKHAAVSIGNAGFLEGYLQTLNVAAGDLILASIIGAIVLFFVQLLNVHQGAIVKAGEAAEKAEAAAQGATRAVAKTGEIIPDLNDQIEKTLNILETTSNILGSETLSHNLAITLEKIAGSNPALEQIRELSDMIVLRIKQINGEITHTFRDGPHSGKNDLFDLVSLAAIYTSYLKVETLSFEGDDEDMGRRGCRLSTRYPHYALAVRSVVEALDKLDNPKKKRYKYYTVFNRRPVNFFNPENPNVRNSLANVNWSIFFLEKFCRWHGESDIPYTRYFLNLQERDPKTGTIPPTPGDLEHDLEKRFILCNINAGTVRPCLWGEAAHALTKRNAWLDLPEDQATAMIAAAEEILPSNEVRETLKDLECIQSLADPSYVILEEDDKLKVEKAIRRYRDVVEFKTLKEVLPAYHAPSSPPKKLRFKNAKIYDDFFSNGVPHDLFAVWDEEKVNEKTKTQGSWSLCIGTMVGESDPTAVEMICTTPDRPLKDLHWDNLEQKLSRLFRRESLAQAGEDGIRVESLY